MAEFVSVRWDGMRLCCGQIRVVSSISNLFSAQQRWTGAREETFGLQNHIITLYCNTNLHTLQPAGRTDLVQIFIAENYSI